MKTLEIKNAVPKYLDIWSELRSELWLDLSPEESREEISEFTDTDNYEGYIGFLDSNPVGFIELSIHALDITGQADRVAYVEGWYIRKDYRSRGYGKQLMQFAEKWTGNRKLKSLASDTDENFPGSLEAHRALGFREIDIPNHFIKVINT